MLTKIEQALKHRGETKVTTVKRTTEATIYFRPYAHHPNKDKLNKVLQRFAYQNQCVEADTKHLAKGQISITFNPAVHNRATRDHVVRHIKRMIEEA